MGQPEIGLRLLTLSATLFAVMGHADLNQVVPALNGLASELNYSQDQFNMMRQEVAEAYAANSGWGLIQAAFPDS